MGDSTKLYVAATLVFLGSVTVAIFRCANSTGYGPAVLAFSFSSDSSLNTPSQYRFNNHGQIVSVEREAYHREFPIAVAVLCVQAASWLPAMALLLKLAVRKSPLHWKGTLLLGSGVVLWAVSEMSSFW